MENASLVTAEMTTRELLDTLVEQLNVAKEEAARDKATLAAVLDQKNTSDEHVREAEESIELMEQKCREVCEFRISTDPKP